MDSVIIKHDRVRLSAGPPPAGSSEGGHGKSVRAIESGGRVTALEVVCSCGERTLVELVYEADPPPTKPSSARPAADPEAQA